METVKLHRMESVRPTPIPFPQAVEISFTEAQKKIVESKKKSMKDIAELQKIYGKLEGKFEDLPREVVRFLQRRNALGLKPMDNHPNEEQVLSWTSRPEFWKQRGGKDEETYFWVSDNASFWNCMADLTSSKILWIDLEANEWDGLTGLTCLIQISTGENNYILDCLAIPNEIKDKLKDALENPEILKVMHGSSNDLRWMQRDFAIFIWPLIDTQIMEEHLSGDKQTAFASLISKYLKIEITKTEKVMGHLSDYRKRPLHPNLVRYALMDTYLLRKLWYQMIDGIGQTDANHITSKCKQHVLRSLFTGANASSKSDKSGLNASQSALYGSLVEARQKLCEKLNLPLPKVATDAVLLNAAQTDKPPFNVHPELRRTFNEGWKTRNFAPVRKINPDCAKPCMKCGEIGHLARTCDAPSTDKAKTRKEFYKDNPEALLKEKERLREKRRMKRQATGETKAWHHKQRDQRMKP